MSRPAAKQHECKCGCGTLIPATSTWARGHWARKQAADRLKLTPLPGPDVPDDELDLGHLDLPEPPRERTFHRGDDESPADFARRVDEAIAYDLSGDDTRAPGDASWPMRGSADEPDDLEPDRPPGHLSAPTGSRQRQAGSRVRVTAATRKDITAKIKMPLFVGGKVWEARDPLCGGTFISQLDPIADAFTSIICDSADLVAFFTGPAGGFMKYLELATALQPVVMMIWAHHIAHSIELPPQNGQVPGQPNMAQYAA